MAFVQNNSVALNLFPMKYGQKREGVEKGPEYLTEMGLLKCLKELNIEVAFTTTIQPDDDPQKTQLMKCGAYCEKVANLVSEMSGKNLFCLNIGGDHSIGTGTLSGLLKTYPDLCVVWVDAHLDLNTAKSSMSGNPHGMPCSFVLLDHREKAVKDFPKEYAWSTRKISPSQLAYIGIRDPDDAEAETVIDLRMCAYDMDSIDRLGIHECIQTALRKIDPEEKRPIHVSFDIDSIDPTIMPSTGTAVKGGMTLRELLCVAETVHKTGRMVGLDVVEFNPDKTGKNEDAILTAENIFFCMKAFLGQRRRSFN